MSALIDHRRDHGDFQVSLPRDCGCAECAVRQNGAAWREAWLDPAQQGKKSIEDFAQPYVEFVRVSGQRVP